MSNSRKVLFVFEQPAALRELIHSASSAGFELLPVRGRHNALAALQAQSGARAIIVENDSRSDTATLEILQNAQSLQPKLRRVILMESPDLTKIVNGVHSGTIETILYRPVDARQFFAAVADAGSTFNPEGTSAAKDVSIAARRR